MATAPIRSRTVPGPTSPRLSRRPGARRSVVVVTTLALGLTAIGCSSNLGSPDAVTSQGDSFTHLWRIFLLIAIGVAGLIWVLVAWSIIAYRRRSHDHMPSQRQYNIPLEVGYFAAPLLLVAVLFGISVVATNDFTDLKDDPDVTVDVYGFQWQWQFQYLGEDVTLSGSEVGGPEMVLPVGETVRFILRADDVNHSFWVPEFLEKRDLIPGVDNQIQVEIMAPGEWRGVCAEYCGLDHWTMAFTVRAVPRADYDAWLAQAKQRPQPIVTGAPAVSPTSVPTTTTVPPTTTVPVEAAR